MTKQQRSARVERFCIEVVRPGNSLSDAYRIAFQPKHCSPKTINEKASRLRKTDKVEARVKILVAPVIQTAQLTYARWLQEVDRVAICDPRKLFDTHGNPIDIPNLGDEEAPVIAGFEITEEFSGKGADRVPVGYTRKFKLVDKLKALELAGKARKFMEQDDGESDNSKIPPVSKWFLSMPQGARSK